jgi:hypothetical protein
MKENQMLVAPSVPVKLGQFRTPWFDPMCGEKGAWVAGSIDGTLLAVAEKIRKGWRFWLVRNADGETLAYEDVCAS